LQLISPSLDGVDHRAKESLYVDSAALGIIRIERTHQFANRGRQITIWIDEEAVGRVRDGAVADFAVAPGLHEVQAELDWCTTEIITVSVESGRQVALCLSSPLRGWRILNALAAISGPPGAYIALTQLEPKPIAGEPAV
jgi:hypothetical protein